MPTPFQQTSHALAEDRSPAELLAWALGMLLLLAWGAWFVLGQVTVYETSRRARLEVMQLPHHVAAPMAGPILGTPVAIGEDIAAGAPLFELDATDQRLQLAEARARLAGLPPRIASIRQEQAAMERARADDLAATQAALDAARARLRETEATLRFAASHETRLRRQSEAGGVPEIDALRARAEAERLAATRDALTADLRRLEQDRQMRANDSAARIENLARSAVALTGEIAQAEASIARIEATIARHRVGAPVAGRIGDVAALHPGAWVTEGQRLVSVIPPGELKIIGEFDPASAMGRVQPGQPARLRLEGFPWAQFGAIEATVTRVASEIRDGRIRVELAPATGGVPPALLQHGLPGEVEIAVERAAPAALVLRSAGLLLSAPMRQAATAPTGP